MKDVSGGRYAFAVGWRIGLFVLLALVFAMSLAVAARTGNSGRGSFGESLMVLFFRIQYHWLSIFFLFAAALALPTMRRSRSVGLGWLFGSTVSVLLLADGELWNLIWQNALGIRRGFQRGVVWGQLPVYTLAALLVMTLLAFAEPRERGSLRARYGRVGAVAAILLLALTVTAAFWSALQAGMAYDPAHPQAPSAHNLLLRLGKPVQVLGLAACAGLLCLIGLELRHRHPRSGQAPVETS